MGSNVPHSSNNHPFRHTPGKYNWCSNDGSLKRCSKKQNNHSLDYVESMMLTLRHTLLGCRVLIAVAYTLFFRVCRSLCQKPSIIFSMCWYSSRQGRVKNTKSGCTCPRNKVQLDLRSTCLKTITLKASKMKTLQKSLFQVYEYAKAYCGKLCLSFQQTANR